MPPTSIFLPQCKKQQTESIPFSLAYFPDMTKVHRHVQKKEHTVLNVRLRKAGQIHLKMINTQKIEKSNFLSFKFLGILSLNKKLLSLKQDPLQLALFCLVSHHCKVGI